MSGCRGGDGHEAKKPQDGARFPDERPGGVAVTGAAAPFSVRMDAVVQGSFQVSSEPDLILTTILGSCVAVCLHDPVAGIGGMNHFLLPESRFETKRNLRYGVHAMELLINALLQGGASRERLVAKAFGGARMVPGFRDIGEGNILFARDFLAHEGLPLVAESLGGTRARRLRFWPASGRARMILVEPQNWSEPRPVPPSGSAAGAIDLF